jgi:glucose/arabinose dehydrogenase
MFMKPKKTQTLHSPEGSVNFKKPTGEKRNVLGSKFSSVVFIAILLVAGVLLQGCELIQDFKRGKPFGNTKPVKLELVADDMVSPLGLVAVPDDSKRLFVIDQIGKVWTIDKMGSKLDQPFLDVMDRMVDLNEGYDERGLLGLAFHPDYAMNGRVFVYYTALPNSGGPGEEGWNNISRISEFSVSPSDPDQVDLDSEIIVLEIDQPQGNHEGGTIAFGPDGFLYISIGDGGGANDIGPGHVEDWYEVNEGGNGQNIEANLLGNILRIDVNGRSPYAIPSDNPFVGKPGLDEIYAYGFRNPFRFSFDMSGSHRLFVGDAGQHLWEEISVVEKGGNYGWNVKEGTHCFDAANPEEVLASCPDIDAYGNELIDPVIEMKNSNNPLGGRTVTIIGGYVYRGNDIPGYHGKYIFGSYSRDFGPTGDIFIANPAGGGLWDFREIQLENSTDGIGYYLKGFGQDLKGEIYVAASLESGPTGDTGKIFKLVVAEKEK